MFAGFLKNLFGTRPSPPAWYVQTMNSVSAALGQPIIWSESDPGTCVIPMEIDGVIYYGGAHLDGELVVIVGVNSKIRTVTPAIANEVARRNREALHGSWHLDNGVLFKTDMLVQNFNAERVLNALRTMLPVVVAFDRQWLGTGNATVVLQ